MSDSSRKISPVYVVIEEALMLEAPLPRAWAHVLNYPTWQNYSKVEHICGPRGGAGELVILRKEETGFTFPPYYARTILIEPERRLIWKTYSAEAGKETDFFGIVDFKVTAVGHATRFECSALYEFNVPYTEEAELDRFREEQSRNFKALFEAVFPKLRKLCEEGH